jgi:hypothetical protein
MSQKRSGEIEGFKILESRHEGASRDVFTRGQGFSISLTRVAVGPGEADQYKATSSDGLFTVTAASEEEAARGLRESMERAAIKGEL